MEPMSMFEQPRSTVGPILSRYTQELAGLGSPRFGRRPMDVDNTDNSGQGYDKGKEIREKLEGTEVAEGDDSGQDTSDRYSLGPNFLPPRRVVYPGGQGPGIAPTYETGEFRVNELNLYELGPDGKPLGRYNVSEDWRDVLYSMDLKERADLFGKLHARGVYQGRKPTMFFADPSVEGRVVRDLMHIANLEGRTFSWVVKSIMEGVPELPSRGRNGMSDAKARSIIQAAARESLGRQLRQGELPGAVSAMRGRLGTETAEGAARSAIGATAGEEQAAYGIANYAQLMMRLMR